MRVLFGAINLMHYHVQVGANHYARQFDREGHEVLFLSDPLTPLHILRHGTGEIIRSRLQTWKSGGRPFGERGIAFEPLSLVPTYGIFPFSTRAAIEASRLACIPGVSSYCKRKGFGEVDLLWIDNVFYSFLLDKVDHGVSIYRMADELSDYPRYGEGHHAVERELIERADIVLAVTNRLLEKAKEIRGEDRVTLLTPNGVDFDHFDRDERELPGEYRDMPRPIAVFLGVFNAWYNPQLVFRLAEELPDVSFVIISPRMPGAERRSYPNLFTIGPVPYEDVPPYLRHADVGLVPLTFTRKQPVVLALKALQYMAAGLPYVCSSVDERDLGDFAPPGYYPRTESEMVKAIREAIRLKPEEMTRYRDYARENSWARRYASILEHVEAARVPA